MISRRAFMGAAAGFSFSEDISAQPKLPLQQPKAGKVAAVKGTVQSGVFELRSDTPLNPKEVQTAFYNFLRQQNGRIVLINYFSASDPRTEAACKKQRENIRNSAEKAAAETGENFLIIDVNIEKYPAIHQNRNWKIAEVGEKFLPLPQTIVAKNMSFFVEYGFYGTRSVEFIDDTIMAAANYLKQMNTSWVPAPAPKSNMQ